MKTINEFRGEYRFLSNFSPSRIVGSYGIEYRTAEAAFQAGKTDDPALKERIARARSPYQAKGLGRQLELPADWDERRHVVMRAVLESKFEDSLLLQRLLNTEDAVLVEGNTWHDNYWGNCHCNRPACLNFGSNWLGFHLMELRDDRRSRS